jgi:hypothetical protein
MTRKLAISLPDHIAERLDRQKNVSAYIAETLQRRIDHERTLELLAEAGYIFTDEDLADADARILDGRRQVTAEWIAEADALMEAARRHDL